MCVKFGDDPISSLDFSFTGGVPLITVFINYSVSHVDILLSDYNYRLVEGRKKIMGHYHLIP